MKTILGAIVRKLGLVGKSEIPMQDMIEWCIWGLSQIGGDFYETTSAKIKIVDYTGRFPVDLILPVRLIDNSDFVSRGDKIIVADREGEVTLVYKRFAVDDEGYPKIPDSPAFEEALMWCCCMYLALQGNLPNKQISHQYAQQQWFSYCRQARAETYIPTPDQMQRINNIITRIVPLQEQQSVDYVDTFYKERYNKYGN